jgi:4-hydroxy-4-methyl-2-oxoglutarate aldolase
MREKKQAGGSRGLTQAGSSRHFTVETRSSLPALASGGRDWYAQPMSDTASLIEYLKSVDSPTLSNAIETLRVRPPDAGFAPLQVRCLFPELGRLCGFAVTAQVETMTEMHAPEEARFLELFRAVEASPKPAVVAFQEIGARGEYAAHSGEIMATAFTRLGAVGLVTDCAVRDIPEVRAMRFQYLARGTVASHARFKIVRVGVPIQILGLEIEPGDLLHGDENGLMTVPEAALAGLERAVQHVRERERRLMDFMRSPEFAVDKLKGRFIE